MVEPITLIFTLLSVAKSSMTEVAPQKEYKIDFRKTSKSDESIGTEKRTIDNRKYRVNIVRELRVSKECTRTINISMTQQVSSALEAQLGGTVGFSEISSISGSIKNSLEQKVADVDDSLSVAAQEIRSRLHEQVTELLEHIRRSKDELNQHIHDQSSKLRNDKVAREDLANLLQEVSLRLKGDFDLPGDG